MALYLNYSETWQSNYSVAGPVIELEGPARARGDSTGKCCRVPDVQRPETRDEKLEPDVFDPLGVVLSFGTGQSCIGAVIIESEIVRLFS